MTFNEDDAEDFSDSEEIDDEETDESASDDSMPCPYCRKPVYEDAEICPHCRNYLSDEEAPTRKPLWIVLVAIVILIVVLLRWGHF